MVLMHVLRRGSVLSVGALALVMFAGHASAESPALPPGAINPSTAVVVYINAAQASPEKVAAAAHAAISDAAVDALQLKKYAEFYKQFTDVGVDSAVIVVSVADEKPMADVEYLHIKAGADGDAAQKNLQERLGSDYTVEWGAPYLVVHEKNKPLPVAGNDDDAKPVREALDGADGAAATVVLLANAPILSKVILYSNALHLGLSDLAPALFRGKYTRIALIGGETPALHLVAQAYDEDQAKQIQGKAERAVDVFRKFAQNYKSSDGLRGMNELAAALTPHAQGTKVTLDLEGPGFKAAAQLMLSGMAVARGTAQRNASASNEKQLLLAVLMYGNDFHNRMPASLKDLAPYVGSKQALDRLLVNPRTGDKIGYEYVKAADKASQITDPTNTPILYELKNGKRDLTGCIGYADGHVDVGPHSVDWH